MEDRSRDEKVDVEWLTLEEGKESSDVCQKERDTFTSTATCKDVDETLIQHGNEFKDSAEKIAPKYDVIETPNIHFPSIENRPHSELLNNAHRKGKTDILHKDGNTINHFLPHKAKTSSKSAAPSVARDCERMTVEDFDSDEADFSNDNSESTRSREGETETQISNGSDDFYARRESEAKNYTKLEGASACAVLIALLSVIGYIGDLISDLVVSYFWYRDGHPLWFGLSLFFALFPTVVVNGMSYTEMKSESALKRSTHDIRQRSCISKMAFPCHFLFLGLFYRQLENFLFTFELWTETWDLVKISQVNHQEHSYEKVGLCGLTLVEGFMESAPQLILQIYTMSKIADDSVNKTRVIAQVASISFSLFMLSLSVTNFERANHLLSKPETSGIILHFLWHLFTIAPRVISVSLFATLFPKACLAVCLCQVAATVTWITYQKCVKGNHEVLPPTLNKTRIAFLALVIAVVQLFTSYEQNRTKTRCRLLFYYSVVGVQNAVFISLWFTHVEEPHQFINVLALSAVLVCFALGILFMVIYYRFFHYHIRKHPERWKMKIIFPEAEKKEEDTLGRRKFVPRSAH